MATIADYDREKKKHLEIEEKLLEVFNVPHLWDSTHYTLFLNSYRALIASMESPIQKAIDKSELRQSVQLVRKIKEDILAPLGTKCFPGMGHYKPYTVGEDLKVKTILFTTATNIKLGQVTPEAVDKMMQKTVKNITDFEILAVNTFKEMIDSDDITLFVRQEFVPYVDPHLPKQQKIGLYGWEEIALVANQ